jgi:hypothetical protein
MARFAYVNQEEKEALKARALKSKPNAFNLVATERGWEQSRPNGTLELLVSFAGLDELLGDVAPTEVVGEPVEVVVPAEEVKEEVVQEPVVEVKEEPKAEEPAPAPKKTGGRPKKVVAVEPTPETTE